ncbi:hypothetical protein IHE44_0006515, partial [Lamprotornis superbus]
MSLPSSRTRWVSDFFSYETTKSVVVKSWVVGVVNRGVQLLILAYFVGWVFLHEKAYQVRDTAIESSVVTKVKGVGRYAGQVMDTADYITPPQGTSVFVVVTKQIRTEDQAQGVCPESEAAFHCSADRDCRELSPGTSNGVLMGIWGRRGAPDSTDSRLGIPEVLMGIWGLRDAPGGTDGSTGVPGILTEFKGPRSQGLGVPGLLTGRCVRYNATLRTCEIQGWCPPEVDTVDVEEQRTWPLPCPQCHPLSSSPIMLEAENFTLLIKNSIRFPLFGFEKTNLPPPGSGVELGRCRFHPQLQPLCPILRLGDVARLAGQDFPALAATVSRDTGDMGGTGGEWGGTVGTWRHGARVRGADAGLGQGGVLGIKIGWVCDLDRAWELCLPRYSFTRLDSLARTPAPGYNFRHARYYRWPDGSERRTLIKAFGIRFDVLVYGSVRVGLETQGLAGGAGKFGIVPTLINTVAAFTSIGV